LLAEARTLFERAMKLEPSPELDIKLGVLAGEEARFYPEHEAALMRDSLKRIERGMAGMRAIHRVEPQWQFYWGAALVRADRPAEALPELEQVLRDWPDNPQVHRVIAIAYAALQRWDEAVAHVEAALRVQPDDAFLWLRLGAFRVHAGQRDAAVQALRQAIDVRQAELGRVAPDDPLVQDALSELSAITPAVTHRPPSP